MVSLYLNKGSPVEKAFEKAVPSNLWPKVKRTYVRRKDVPSAIDLVINSGKGDPPTAQHRFARNVGAQLVCLPEAAEFLVDHIIEAVSVGKPLTLAAATLAGRLDV